MKYRVQYTKIICIIITIGIYLSGFALMIGTSPLTVSIVKAQTVIEYEFPCKVSLTGNWAIVKNRLGKNDQELTDYINEVGRFGHNNGAIEIDFNSNPTGNDGIGPRAFGICENNIILASRNGTIIRFQDEGMAGWVVRVRHADNQVSVYAHMPPDGFDVSRINVPINPGDSIGPMGKTGVATGVHVHFAIVRADDGPTVSNWRFKNPALSEYAGEFSGRNYQSIMTIGSTQRVQIRIKNIGTATWDGLTRITALPRESTSPFYDPSWIAPTRIVGTESTPPGAIATFEFTLKAPTTPGQYQLNFALLHEGVTWFNEPVEGAVSLPITVIPSYKGELVEQAFQSMMTIGSTQRVQIRIKNTGTATWDGLTRITALPRESISPFYDPSWIAPTRIVGTESTPPGAIATFEFTLKAPTTLGQYQINFALLHEGVTWFSEPVEGAVSLPIQVTTTQDQERNVFLPLLKKSL